jgi:glycosyltransferase involved in cell wall biosynthesis
MPIPVSAIIITKNAQRTLDRCCASLAGLVDEIVVVDCGSVDATVDIARKHTPHVFHQDWLGYARQKRVAIDKTRNDWVLWIDADEEVSPGLREELSRRPLDGADGFFIPRLVRYLGGWVRHCGWYPAPVLRLFKKSRGRFSDAIIHESVRLDGTAGSFDNPLYHYPYRNIDQHLEKMREFTDLGAQSLCARGRRVSPLHALAHAMGRFLRMYFFKAGFLDGPRGLVICVLGAYSAFLKYAKAWEMQRRADTAPGE